MSDFEKNRASHVLHLEAQTQNLQRQLSELQAQAKWIPAANTVLDPQTEEARITLAFAGKRVTVTLPYSAIRQMDVTSATSAVIDSMYQNLIADQFREIIKPEIEKTIKGVNSVTAAGKW